MKTLAPVFCLFVASALGAQTIVVDYPDSVITAPAGQYPIYTPTNGAEVRGQNFCPSTFSGLPTVPMMVTRVGVQIAGNLPYKIFTGRAGKTSVTALTTSFATNLPDQRVQFDLSGQNLPGGGTGTLATTQINVWVEFDLCHPFVFTPGDNLIVDIHAQSLVANQFCRTAIGAGVARMLNTAYTSATTTGAAYTSGGIKLRFVFEPLYAPIAFGKGCPGTNNAVPMLTGAGSTKLGSPGVLSLSLSQARPNAGAFLVAAPDCLDLPIFGGCHIYPNLTILVGQVTSPNGTAGLAFPTPSSAALAGVAITMQYAVDDPKTAAKPLTFSLSNGLRFSLQN